MVDKFGPWYRALVPVDHDGAHFAPGALVGWQHPVIRAHPESFERVRIERDGTITQLPDGPLEWSQPVPAALMPDGSTRPLDVHRPAPRRGPRPAELATRDDVERKSAELTAAGLPAGERPVAAALGISRSTVRRRRGKPG